MKRQASISLRLTLWFGVFFFLGWLFFGTVMWMNLSHTLRNERHQTLARRVDRLQELILKDQSATKDDRYQDFAGFAHATGNGLSEIFLANGRRAYPSPSAAAASFSWPQIKPNDSERFINVESSGQPYWVLIRSFTLNGQSLFLLAAAPESGNILVLQQFWTGLLASIPLMLILSSAAGYWISSRALAPVDRITAKVRSITIRNLSERLPVKETGDELQRLAETCNAMLARLDSAVSQIKRFTADASHELRGPLSFTRTVAEVALRNYQLNDQSRKAFQDIADEASKTSILLEEMLTLARADSNTFDHALEPVDLVAIVEETCELARPIATVRGLSLAVSCAPEQSVTVLGDFPSLRRMVWVLLDNALKYTDAPGFIEVSLNTASRQANLTVRDNGIGIAPGDLPYIFDRFYRADPSRSHVEGTGLGLAIAKWIAEIHQADLTVASEENKGTTFTVAFQLAASYSQPSVI
jgi:heavy metal sensor kinase